MVGFLLNVTLYQLKPQGLKVTENLLSIGWHNLGAQLCYQRLGLFLPSLFSKLSASV